MQKHHCLPCKCVEAGAGPRNPERVGLMSTIHFAVDRTRMTQDQVTMPEILPDPPVRTRDLQYDSEWPIKQQSQQSQTQWANMKTISGDSGFSIQATYQVGNHVINIPQILLVERTRDKL